MSTKTFFHRTAAAFFIIMLLFTALPVKLAGAAPLNITSVASGTWEATAWPTNLRSGTISVTAGNTTVTGTGTAFTTELSVGNILKTTTNIQIGTVASITSPTSLTLANVPATTRTNIAYNAQGVGPADNVTIANGHNVTVAAKPVNQTGTVTVNSGGTLTVSNAGAVFSTLTVNGTVNATTGHTLGTLTVNNGGLVLADGTSGAYTASSLTIASGATVNITRNFTVNAATLIAGTINFSSNSVTARAMLFKGSVTLQSGATWSESTSGNGSNNTYNFQQSFTNNASSFTTSPTSVHTFSGAGKTLGGATVSSIARVAITGTYTNNGTLSVGTMLSGTGSLTNSGTLNVGGTVSISTLANAGTATKTGAGPMTTAEANFTNTGILNLNGTGTITGITNNAGGTVNLNSSGLVYAFTNATATSTLNIFALSVPHFHSLVVGAPGNTVNYGGAGDQTVKRITYSNLIFSGSGDKSISMTSNSTLANGILSIAPTGTARANITGLNLSVNHLTLAGVGKAPGTWGSSSSAASNTDDTFFAPTIGYLNVTNDSRLAQSITFTSTPPANAEVGGPTYTPTAIASSGLPVTFAIDSAAASVCSISGGVISFIGSGTCEIEANQAGNATYLPTTQQQSFDVRVSVNISIGGQLMTSGCTPSNSPYFVASGESLRVSCAGVNNGPVEITSGVNSIAAERVIYKVQGVQTSFTELMGLPDGQLDNVYWLPWYNNVELDTQLRIANATNNPATVNVTIGGVPQTPLNLAAGESTRVSYTGVNSGPVQIVSTQNIVAAERVIYKVAGKQTSFSEMMALPESQLDTTYWLPWYNNVELDTQLRIANTTNNPATVTVTIGGVPQTPLNLAAGESTRVSYPMNDGPVQIVSDQNIVAAERVIYKVQGVQTSFTEMMALPASQLDTTYWLPWYNNVDLDTQLRFANTTNSTATVHIYIGGVEMGTGFTLDPNESTRQSFVGINNGPVQIVSDQTIVAAERVIYKVAGKQTSFSEMMGLPNLQLDTFYWFPWYNNTDLDTQLRFGVP